MRLRGQQVNTPLSDDIAVLMPNDAISNRDIVLHYRDSGLQHTYVFQNYIETVTHYSTPYFSLMVLVGSMLTLNCKMAEN